MVDWNLINHHSNDFRWYLSTQFICFDHFTQIFEFYIHLICTNDGPIFDIHKKKTNWKHFPVLANYLVLVLFCTKRERWTETGAQNARALPNICFLGISNNNILDTFTCISRQSFQLNTEPFEERKRHKDRKRKSVKHFRWHCIKP